MTGQRPARLTPVLLLLGAGLAEAGAAPAAPAGDFISEYVKPATADYEIYYDELKDRHFLEAVATELNRVLKLPAPLTLKTAECGHSTTTYAADTRIVTVCYEFLDAVIVIAGESAGSQPRAEQLFSGAVTFALLSEIGAALTGIYALPVPGGAGVAGDEFAAITLASAERSGDPSAAAAIEFYDAALAKPDSGFEYLETHHFDRSRLERVACILYGNAPANHAASIERGIVLKSRAPRCAEEVVALATRWDRYLKAHTREPAPEPVAPHP